MFLFFKTKFFFAEIQLLDGIDIRDVNIYSLRSCLGLVSQEPVLFDLTIEENIAYAKENIPMEEIIEAARKANVHDFIQRLPHVSEKLTLEIYSKALH